MNEFIEVFKRLIKKEISIEKAYRDQRDCINKILMDRKEYNEAEYDKFKEKYGNTMNGFWISARTDLDLLEIINKEPKEYKDIFASIKKALLSIDTIMIEVCYNMIIESYIQLFELVYNKHEDDYEEYCKKTNNIYHNAPIRMMEINKIITILKDSIMRSF